jgi:hypothetical protein
MSIDTQILLCDVSIQEIFLVIAKDRCYKKLINNIPFLNHFKEDPKQALVETCTLYLPQRLQPMEVEAILHLEIRVN